MCGGGRRRVRGREMYVEDPLRLLCALILCSVGCTVQVSSCTAFMNVL